MRMRMYKLAMHSMYMCTARLAYVLLMLRATWADHFAVKGLATPVEFHTLMNESLEAEIRFPRTMHTPAGRKRG